MHLEERLRPIFSSMNDWVKYAESKNAALLFSDSASVYAIFGFLKDNKTFINIDVLIPIYSALFLLFFSSIWFLVSFIPRIKIDSLKELRKPKKCDNLIFYGDIANYSHEGYLQSLCSGINLDTKEVDQIEKYYMQQIVANSRIALKKFQYFNVSIILTLLAMLAIFIGGLIYLL
jgi:hypothetical protein